MGMFLSDRRPKIFCDPEKGAKQSFKDECDINTILARHRKGAMVTHVNANAGVFADVSEITDYREMIERVRSANEYFMGLSAKVRTFFQNDAAEFLDFISEPDNEAKLVELGLGPALEEAPEPPEAPSEPVVVPEVPVVVIPPVAVVEPPEAPEPAA